MPKGIKAAYLTAANVRFYSSDCSFVGFSEVPHSVRRVESSMEESQLQSDASQTEKLQATYTCPFKMNKETASVHAVVCFFL